MSALKNFLIWRSTRNVKNFYIQKNVRQASTNKFLNVQINNETNIAVVTMQRPPVNGLNLELLSQLLTTFLELEKNKSRGMILTSIESNNIHFHDKSSPTVFSAGLDIMEMYKPAMDRLKSFWTVLQDTWLQLFSSSYPTVALINGHSPAGGCLLACCCEYRIMLEGNFTIGLNETQLGIVAPSWFIDSFRSVVPRRITELALTQGKLFTVDEALKIGLIDEIAKDREDGMIKAHEFLSLFKKISPTARAQTKLSVRYDAIKRLQDGREQDLKTFVKFVHLPEVQKGLDLYMQELKKRSKS